MAPPTATGTRRAPQRPHQLGTKKIKPKKAPFTRRLRRDWPLLVMVAPTVVLMLTFTYIPLLGNVIAFQDYSPFDGFAGSPFVGLEQFERLISDPYFWDAVTNTLIITATQLVLFFPIPIILALIINSLISHRIKRTIQGILYLPHFLSWVIIVALFQQMVGGAGLLNQRLRDLGLAPIDIMTDPSTFPLLVTSQAVWKDAGWGMIIFLAALSTVNVELYEAAAADGAGPMRRLWHITLPALRPVIVLLLILRLGDALNVGFEQILLQRDNVGVEAGEVLDTYVYYTGVIDGDWSYATAAGLVKGVVGVILVIGANKLAHLLGEQGIYQRGPR